MSCRAELESLQWAALQASDTPYRDGYLDAIAIALDIVDEHEEEDE